MAAVTGAVIATATVANSAYQGKKARSAAKSAANTQAQAAREASQLTASAQEQLRADLSPFRQAGETALPLLQEMATAGPIDRTAQLQSNPLFQAALNSRDRSSLGAAATQGRIGTGGLSQQLSENFLLSASPLIQQQIQEEQIREGRLNNLVGLGQSSAAQVGTAGLQSAQIQGQAGMSAADAISAGTVAAQQANANRNAEILNNLPTLIGAIKGV